VEFLELLGTTYEVPSRVLDKIWVVAFLAYSILQRFLDKLAS
jgi:hypothetical protein